MPRYKPNEQDQMMMLPINFHEQLLAGTFEYTINDIIDNHIDLSQFNNRYKNEKKGACAFHPAVLLKIVLYAYSKGILSSRKMEETCRTNIIFKALTGDAIPEHSTIVAFVSRVNIQWVLYSLVHNIEKIVKATCKVRFHKRR
jgi:transposase